jgi:hypothetical protein
MLEVRMTAFSCNNDDPHVIDVDLAFIIQNPQFGVSVSEPQPYLQAQSLLWMQADRSRRRSRNSSEEIPIATLTTAAFCMRRHSDTCVNWEDNAQCRNCHYD